MKNLLRALLLMMALTVSQGCSVNPDETTQAEPQVSSNQSAHYKIKVSHEVWMFCFHQTQLEFLPFIIADTLNCVDGACFEALVVKDVMELKKKSRESVLVHMKFLQKSLQYFSVPSNTGLLNTEILRNLFFVDEGVYQNLLSKVEEQISAMEKEDRYMKADIQPVLSQVKSIKNLNNYEYIKDALSTQLTLTEQNISEIKTRCKSPDVNSLGGANE